MLLFIFFIIYFSLVFVTRSLLFWRKTGINPLTFDRADDAHGFNGKIFKGVAGLEMVVIAIYAFKAEWYAYLLPFWYLESEWLAKTGWALLVISLLIVWVAQGQMAHSWRIGIDEENRSELVTHGLFRFSRNPIFLGILMANLGLFLVIPNTFTLLIFVVSFISIHTQVRLEEAFLRKSFGEQYMSYSDKVRRWL